MRSIAADLARADPRNSSPVGSLDQAYKRALPTGEKWLKQAGYKPDLYASIGVALTWAAWERLNGSVKSPRSQTDWFIWFSSDPDQRQQPYGPTSKNRRELLAKEERARVNSLNSCIREYLSREFPNLEKRDVHTESDTPSEDEVTQHAIGNSTRSYVVAGVLY